MAEIKNNNIKMSFHLNGEICEAKELVLDAAALILFYMEKAAVSRDIYAEDAEEHLMILPIPL